MIDETNNLNVVSDEFFDKCGMRVLKSIRRIIRAVDIHSRKLIKDFDVTAPQMICLYTLGDEREMTQSELSRQVSMGISTINGVIDRLEKKGLVIRERDTKDRRKVFVRVTDSGKELTKAAPSLLQEKLSNSLRSLPELEQTAIVLSLERVVELMEAEHLDASPNLVPNSLINERQEE